MIEKDKISIIVPVYNVEDYLKKCIDSIVRQQYKNLEIILVDDGSIDNSGEICEKYAKEDDRIKVIHKKNGGLSDARNVGIENATGQYIGFVDSDDWIADSMYSYLKELIDTNNADISICGYYKFTNCDEINLKNVKNEKNIYVFDKQKAISELLKQENIQDYAWNKLYKIELFENIKYPYGRKMEDTGTTYKLFDRAQRIVLGNEVQYYYLQRSNSIVNNKNFSLYKDKYELTKERYIYIKNKYPNIMENDLDMIDKIISLYNKKQNKEIKEYVNNQKVMKLYCDIMKNANKIRKEMSTKMKIKTRLFEIQNYKEYRSFK